ncbi:MAG: hypothetical protein DUD27_04845 [Lachnospiraceae bacterium]|uniref:Uncharacterized protein n=1 Tax=Candidatus Weimeria bifida TaxID=2599074 RepID=A0A6N7IZW5_9FIRM|nr:hypothetical protein [Candidatus Weimeria bifida]RRF96434.1 MAG: hypothetical protein DUD27_04845 [Lachnospiraceae bacterium]
MIDTERVKKMTQMALREKRSGIKLDSVDDIDKKDFLSFYGVRSFFQSTIIYCVLFILIIVLIFSTVTVQVNRLNIAITVFAGIMGYLFFMLFYSGYSRRQNIRRFAEYQQIADDQRNDLKILEEMYEKEERESHGQQEKTDRDEQNEDRPGDEEPNQ